jgi:hypothetical protein
MLPCESFNGKVDGNEVVVPFVSTAFFSDIKLFSKFPSFLADASTVTSSPRATSVTMKGMSFAYILVSSAHKYRVYCYPYYYSKWMVREKEMEMSQQSEKVRDAES